METDAAGEPGASGAAGSEASGMGASLSPMSPCTGLNLRTTLNPPRHRRRGRNTERHRTNEAEYGAMAQGVKEMIFMRYVWSFALPDREVGCTTVFEDNKGAIYLAINPALTPNTKHRPRGV